MFPARMLEREPPPGGRPPSCPPPHENQRRTGAWSPFPSEPGAEAPGSPLAHSSLRI